MPGWLRVVQLSIRGRSGSRERKKSARVGLWKRRQAEESKNRLSRFAWKSRNIRGIPTFPQPRGGRRLNLNRTFHLLLKPDILICYQQCDPRRCDPRREVD